jgi:tetratricopeptide (TPR) repeat protein
MMLKIKLILALLFIGITLYTKAQQDAKYLYDGNALYYGGNIPESTKLYTKALEENPNNRKANYNLGTSLFKSAELLRLGKVAMPPGSKITPDSMAKLIYDQAAQNFAVVANSVSNKDTLHNAWHNIGNCYLKKKDYQQAVTAYKKALKYNAKDEETRYNLAYALKHLPKDKKNGGANKNQEQKKKEEDKKDQQKNAQPQQSQMNKEQAEQLLKALMDSERKLQDKRKQKAEVNTNTLEKDW